MQRRNGLFRINFRYLIAFKIDGNFVSYFYLIDTRNNEKLSRCQTIMN